jgi:hypothetical protein
VDERCARAVRTLRSLSFAAVALWLVTPERSISSMIGSTGEPAPAPDGMGIVAGVKDAANQLQLYLDCAAKTGGRPTFSKPPVSDLFARIFD